MKNMKPIISKVNTLHRDIWAIVPRNIKMATIVSQQGFSNAFYCDGQLRSLADFPEVVDVRKSLGMHRLFLNFMRITDDIAEEMIRHSPHSIDEVARLMHCPVEELLQYTDMDDLIDFSESGLRQLFASQLGNVVVYGISQFNKGTTGAYTHYIGGDSYRADVEDIFSLCHRIQELSEGMHQKAAVALGAEGAILHGGVKKEFIILQPDGSKSSMPEFIRALIGAYAIQKGLKFANHYLIKHSDLTADDPWRIPTAADTLTGKYYDLMCHIWLAEGIRKSDISCLQPMYGGIQGVSNFTAQGTIAALQALTLQHPNIDYTTMHLLVEGVGGGVGRAFVKRLTELNDQIPLKNIHGFDISEANVNHLLQVYPELNAKVVSENGEYYRQYLSDIPKPFIWVNCANGDQLTPDLAQLLLDQGCILFTGPANTVLHRDTEAETVRLIENAGAHYVPGEVINAGGWLAATVALWLIREGIIIEEQHYEIVHRMISNRNALTIEAICKIAAVNHGSLATASQQHIRNCVQNSNAMTLTREKAESDYNSFMKQYLDN